MADHGNRPNTPNGFVMLWKHLLVLLALIVTGCGPTASTDTDTGNSAPNATPAAGGDNTQTVEGSGFSFQAPADWTVLRTRSGVGVSSPFDVNNPVSPISFVVSIMPVASRTLTPKDFVATLLNADKGFGDVESEAPTTVSGREATKLVMTVTMRLDDTSDDFYVARTVKVYVPLDARLVVAQSTGPDEQVVAMMPQIDAIIASIKLK